MHKSKLYDFTCFIAKTQASKEEKKKKITSRSHYAAFVDSWVV